MGTSAFPGRSMHRFRERFMAGVGGTLTVVPSSSVRVAFLSHRSSIQVLMHAPSTSRATHICVHGY